MFFFLWNILFVFSLALLTHYSNLIFRSLKHFFILLSYLINWYTLSNLLITVPRDNRLYILQTHPKCLLFGLQQTLEHRKRQQLPWVIRIPRHTHRLPLEHFLHLHHQPIMIQKPIPNKLQYFIRAMYPRGTPRHLQLHIFLHIEKPYLYASRGMSLVVTSRKCRLRGWRDGCFFWA